MQINKEKLSEISGKRSAIDRKRFREKREDIYWKVESAALSTKIISRLKSLGMTRKDLAEKMGVTPACITRYLSEASNLEFRTLVKLQRVLKCRIIDTDEEDTPKVQVLMFEYRVPTSSFQTEQVEKKENLILDYA